MPYSVKPVKAPDGTPCVVVQSHPEPMEAMALLRMLKAAYPELFREVWYEIQAVNGKPRIEVPEE